MTIRKIINHGNVRWLFTGSVLGKKTRKTFKTHQDSKSFEKEFIKKISDDGRQLASMSQVQKTRIAFLLALMDEHGLTEQEVIDAVLEKRKVTPLVPFVVQECLKSKELNGCRARYLKQLRHVIDHFANAFEHVRIDRVTPNEIEAWIYGGNYSSAYRASRFKDVRTLFSFALKRAYIEKTPFVHLDCPIVQKKTPGILRVKAVAKLMRTAHNRDREICPHLALGLFCGLRPAEIEKIRSAQFMLEQGYVEVTYEMSKATQRRVVKVPANALEWLKIATTYPLVNWRRRFDRIRRQAGLFKNWPHDAMRHTAATFLFALTENADQVAKNLGHGVQVLKAHYTAIRSPDGQLVTHEMAVRYFNIRPAEHC